jgi:hypothetical protein
VEKTWKIYMKSHEKWIGLRENRNRKFPLFSYEICWWLLVFPVINLSLKPIHWSICWWLETPNIP